MSSDTSASWSPGGERVAFVSERSGGAQIYVAGADGSGAKRVTVEGGHNTDPAWSPDGTKIAYVSRDGSFDAASLYQPYFRGRTRDEVLPLAAEQVTDLWGQVADHYAAAMRERVAAAAVRTLARTEPNMPT